MEEVSQEGLVSKDPVVNVKTEEIIMSPSIGHFALALSKAQGAMKSVSKDEKGYGYNYSSLASTIDESRKPLADNELSLSQVLLESNEKVARFLTMVLHSSGEYFGGITSFEIIEMNGVNSAQKKGATVSYGRRYARQAILDMASEDNDASSKGFTKDNKVSTSSIPTKVVNKGAAPAKNKGSFRNAKVETPKKQPAPSEDL